jgi:hypothetical protein
MLPYIILFPTTAVLGLIIVFFLTLLSFEALLGLKANALDCFMLAVEGLSPLSLSLRGYSLSGVEALLY